MKCVSLLFRFLKKYKIKFYKKKLKNLHSRMNYLICRWRSEKRKDQNKLNLLDYTKLLATNFIRRIEKCVYIILIHFLLYIIAQICYFLL